MSELAKGISFARATQNALTGLRVQVAAPALVVALAAAAENADPVLVELRATNQRLLQTFDALEALCAEMLAATSDAEALAITARLDSEYVTLRDLTRRQVKLLPLLHQLRERQEAIIRAASLEPSTRQ